jgi:hypothetical protein
VSARVAAETKEHKAQKDIEFFAAHKEPFLVKFVVDANTGFARLNGYFPDEGVKLVPSGQQFPVPGSGWPVGQPLFTGFIPQRSRVDAELELAQSRAELKQLAAYVNFLQAERQEEPVFAAEGAHALVALGEPEEEELPPLDPSPSAVPKVVICVNTKPVFTISVSDLTKVVVDLIKDGVIVSLAVNRRMRAKPILMRLGLVRGKDEKLTEENNNLFGYTGNFVVQEKLFNRVFTKRNGDSLLDYSFRAYSGHVVRGRLGFPNKQ